MHEIRIPKSGMSTVEVDITEKVTLTLEADAAGIIAEILVAVGDSRDVGDVVCVLSTD